MILLRSSFRWSKNDILPAASGSPKWFSTSRGVGLAIRWVLGRCGRASNNGFFGLDRGHGVRFGAAYAIFGRYTIRGGRRLRVLETRLRDVMGGICRLQRRIHFG